MGKKEKNRRKKKKKRKDGRLTGKGKEKRVHRGDRLPCATILYEGVRRNKASTTFPFPIVDERERERTPVEMVA